LTQLSSYFFSSAFRSLAFSDLSFLIFVSSSSLRLVIYELRLSISDLSYLIFVLSSSSLRLVITVLSLSISSSYSSILTRFSALEPNRVEFLVLVGGGP